MASRHKNGRVLLAPGHITATARTQTLMHTRTEEISPCEALSLSALLQQTATGMPASSGRPRTATAQKKQSMSMCKITRSPDGHNGGGSGGGGGIESRISLYRAFQDPIKCRREALKKLLHRYKCSTPPRRIRVQERGIESLSGFSAMLAPSEISTPRARNGAESTCAPHKIGVISRTAWALVECRVLASHFLLHLSRHSHSPHPGLACIISMCRSWRQQALTPFHPPKPLFL